MPESNLSFFGRLSLAVGTFFSVLGNREFAAGVLRVRDGARPRSRRPAAAPAPAPAPAAAPVKAPAPELREAAAGCIATARPAAARCALHRLR